MSETEVRLFAASEASKILHISRGTVYTLWDRGLLDFWDINGIRTTNLSAIREFLDRTRNTQVDKEGT